MKYNQFNELLQKYPFMYYDQPAKSLVMSQEPLEAAGYDRVTRSSGDELCDDLMVSRDIQFAPGVTPKGRRFLEIFFGNEPEKNAYSDKLTFLCHYSDDIVESLEDLIDNKTWKVVL